MKITEKQLADKFISVKTVEDCADFTDFVYSNMHHIGQELTQRAMIAINNKRKEIKEKGTYTNNNSII